MKDEIKEILEWLKDEYSYNPMDNTGKVYTTISFDEGKLLLDYLTNLQEESDRYKSKCENAIERIKALIIFWKKYSPDNTMVIGQLEGLLDILKGSDKK